MGSCARGSARLSGIQPSDSTKEESVKRSFCALKVASREIMAGMKCVISYTHATIMIIAFTLRLCHDYLADIANALVIQEPCNTSGRRKERDGAELRSTITTAA